MYRKQVRRRRAVLVALVVSCLVLISTHFSEGESGPLHTAQNGVSAVFEPIGNVAGDALKPFRDLVNWFDETFEARGENEQLREQVQELREQAIAGEEAIARNEELESITKLTANDAAAYTAVFTEVISRSPTSWNQSLVIGKGSDDDIAVDDAVVSPDGLVGRVQSVGGGSARVVLLTDQESKVTASVTGGGPVGLLGAEVGDPDDLIFEQINSDDAIKGKPKVVTAGFTDAERDLSSRFPGGIPIGQIDESIPGEQELQGKSHVRPFADMSNLSTLAVLTGGPG